MSDHSDSSNIDLEEDYIPTAKRARRGSTPFREAAGPSAEVTIRPSVIKEEGSDQEIPIGVHSAQGEVDILSLQALDLTVKCSANASSVDSFGTLPDDLTDGEASLLYLRDASCSEPSSKEILDPASKDILFKSKVPLLESTSSEIIYPDDPEHPFPLGDAESNNRSPRDGPLESTLAGDTDEPLPHEDSGSSPNANKH